jgi:DNA repair exonuclease SbcCD nuclease subunit
MKKEIVGIFITDTHLKQQNHEENYQIYKNAVDLCKESGLKNIFHLGDIFDSRKNQSLSNLNFLKRVLDEIFLPNGITLIAIPGNHDKLSYESEESYLDIYENHPSFNLVSSPKILTFAKYSIALIPFFKETTVLEGIINKFFASEEFMKAKESQKPLLAGCHFAINGVMNNDGSLIENPIVPELFADFKKVFCGHYHNSSKIADNIFYIGASIQHTFGETSEKGIVSLDENFETSVHAVVGKKEFISLVLDLDSDFSLSEILEEIKSDKSSNSYRVKVVGSIDNVKNFDVSEIKEVGASVKKVFADEISVYNQGVAASTKYSSSKILEEFNNFCDVEGYSDKIKKEGNIFLNFK